MSTKEKVVVKFERAYLRQCLSLSLVSEVGSFDTTLHALCAEYQYRDSHIRKIRREILKFSTRYF